MASLADRISRADAFASSARATTVETRPSPATRLDSVHASLIDAASDRARPVLRAAHARATRIAAAGGQNAASDEIAVNVYVGDVVASLAAEGELDAADTRVAVRILAQTCSVPAAAAAFGLFLRSVASPVLVELPPVVAAEIQLTLLLHLEVASGVSLWRRSPGGGIECILSVGAGMNDRQVRAEARGAITGRTRLSLLGRSSLCSAGVHRFGTVVAAVVARSRPDASGDVHAYLIEAASALAPVLDRELLLERSADGVTALLGTAENRLTRLGFDLHDGPVQDVLVLGAETRRLRDEIYPFVLESHRELAAGRFDDLLGRLAELDAGLRETAHSLGSASLVSRPLAEILHREVESFTLRTGIHGSINVSGDPESLSAAQRIAIFRVIQESLSNAREHSGATDVEVRLKVGRSAVVGRVTDNGLGFEVNRSLAFAAERGRLGLVGVGERMRMLGGAFEIDSRPGGPTSVQFSLPRWEPFEALKGASH